MIVWSKVYIKIEAASVMYISISTPIVQGKLLVVDVCIPPFHYVKIDRV